MKKFLCKAMVIILFLTTILSLQPKSVKAAIKFKDNLDWFNTYSDYIKSITLPINYYNFQVKSDLDNKKYVKYYIYEDIILNNGDINETFKVTYNKKIIDVKIIKTDYGSYLAIKPLKKGTTDLKITISAKGYHTYKVTTRINIVGAGKTIQTRTANSTYFVSAEKAKDGLGFVSDVIKELNLADKSLYEKVMFSAKWCIDNSEQLEKERVGSHYSYMNKLFGEFMTQLNIPYKIRDYIRYANRGYILILMNDDKWYMVNINEASNLDIEEMEYDIENITENINYYKNVEISEDDSIEAVQAIKDELTNYEKQLVEMQEKLAQTKAGIPALSYVLVSPYTDDVNTKDSLYLGRKFAEEDLLLDPNKDEKSYTGKLPQFTQDKMTINLLHSYGKKVKLPMKLLGIKAEDIGIDDVGRVAEHASFYEKGDDKNSVYILTNVEGGSAMLYAESDGAIVDTMEVEVIVPSFYGIPSYNMSYIKKGEKRKPPLQNANFSDFNIKSENPKIATVSSNGVITAKSKGTTKIILESKTNKNFKMTVWIGVECDAVYG